MSDEKPEAKLARIDERTLNIITKLDEHLEKNDERHASHSKRLGALEALKNQGKGAFWILSILWMLLSAAIGKHLFWDLDRATPAAFAAASTGVPTHAR